jgi:predicted NUDIX family phosphoesterase
MPTFRPEPADAMEEQVLVVRTEGIKPLLGQLFSSSRNSDVLAHVLSNSHFIQRSLAEHDPSYKQVIPYVLVRHRDSHLLLRRTPSQTEKRLHNKYSLGVGGHINPEPSLGHRTIIEAGMHRELEEEVHVAGNHRIEMLGTINDDSTEVGRVHVGLAFLLETDSADFTVNECDLMTAEWASRDRIRSVYAEMETWSQILFDNCIGVSV